MLVFLSRAVEGRDVEHHHRLSGRREKITERIYHPPFSSQSRSSGDLQIVVTEFPIKSIPKVLDKLSLISI
jgi:hypothetical protein